MTENQKMIVHFLTHGKHEKGGGEAHNYDGPLTEEAIVALKKIELPSFEVAYCGRMLRHIDTALACRIPALDTSAIGNDDLMFAALDGDDSAEKKFLDFLNRIKKDGRQEVLLVTSRFYPLLMKYIERGGKEKLGPFQYFIKIMDDMPEWGDDTHVPLMVSGVVSTFEY